MNTIKIYKLRHHMKQVLVSIYILLLILSGCSDETTNPIPEDKSLKLRFTDGYPAEQCWAILYSEDGSTVIKTVAFSGDTEIDFGNIETERVTITIVRPNYSGTKKFYYIDTYYSVTKGLWTFRGSGNSSPIGSVRINQSFPFDHYDYRIFGVENSGVAYLGGFDGSQYTCNDIGIRRIIEQGKISIYNAVYNLVGGYGYYSWNPNQTFNNGTLNEYSVTLNRPLTQYNLQVSKPINRLFVNSAIDNDSKIFMLFYDRADTNTLNHKVLLPNDLTVINYQTNCAYTSIDKTFNYIKISSTKPDVLNIPDTYINANYNAGTNSYDNILINGIGDFIRCSWSNRHLYSDSTTIWNVNATKNATSLKRVVLPTEVSSQIPNFVDSELYKYGVTVFDYNTTSTFDEYINVFLKNTDGKTNLYTESFYYTKND